MLYANQKFNHELISLLYKQPQFFNVRLDHKIMFEQTVYIIVHHYEYLKLLKFIS